MINEAFNKYFKGDRVIWGIIFFLALFSGLVVYSATGNLAAKHHSGSAIYYLFKHVGFLIAGIVIIVFVHNLPYKLFGRLSVVILYIAIGLLGVTLVSGISLNQASRWLTVPGVGVSFQPSEFAKLALMMYIARILAQHQQDGKSAGKAFKPIIIHVMIVCGLIFTEDFSTAALIGGTSMVLMFIGRIPMKYLLSTIGAAALLLMLVMLLSSYVPYFHRAETWKARVERFWNEDELSEDDDGSYQSNMSKMAIATGGVLGKRPGNSRQRYFLPHPYSDFVYAIIIEEYGLWGGILILLAYLILLYRAGVIVKESTRTFPAFLVIGLTLMLVFQAFMNMGVAVGVFPVTGQTLPLVSMGGTSILFTCLSFGAILSVSRFNMEEKQEIKE
ncbi:rod shape-determining protein RodA [Marinilabiliaceae bacterium JC017]|nr:rod shape-determining protein RodA [Marinilabiliaceae bacterium JC017]